MSEEYKYFSLSAYEVFTVMAKWNKTLWNKQKIK